MKDSEIVQMSRSKHDVVDDAADAGEDDGTEKQKRSIGTNKPFNFLLSRLVFVFEQNLWEPNCITCGSTELVVSQEFKLPKAASAASMVSIFLMKKDNGEKIYRKLDSCLVIPPPKGKKAKAITKFLGGAFIGAIPKVTYGYLLGLLANEGYLIIFIPYNVTFDHSQAAREVFKRFHSCLNSVLTYGLPCDGLLTAKLVDLHLYYVGYSNEALFQVLSGSYFSDKLPKVRDLESHLAEERKTRQKQENRALVVASSYPSLSSLKQGLTTISEKKPPAPWNPSSKMRLPLRKSSNKAASSSHAVEAAPVAAPRSKKFMGSPPSHVVGSWNPKHPTVFALQRKQLVWSPLKNKGINPVRKSFVPS
ncbi:alpha/beta hydrolase fold protein, partial [Tanacetum coccineum]